MNRGSRCRVVGQRDRLARFNEAPIHESGKYGNAFGSGTSKRNGFNEAPIHESGKSMQLNPTTADIELQ